MSFVRGRSVVDCLVHVLLLLSGVLIATMSPAAAGILDATWTAPTTNTDGSPLTDLASYRVYYGSGASPCPGSTFISVASPTPSPVSNQTVSFRLSGLVTGTTYSVAVTAIDTSGNESACSPTASAAARAAFDVSPSGTVNFGSVSLGSSADRTFTISNTSAGTMSGAAAVTLPFTIVSGSPFTLSGAGATQAVTVRFTPATTTTVSTTVSFVASGETVSRVVTGVGTTGGTGAGTGGDTVRPSIAITAPTSGAVYTTGSASVTLQGTASDNVGVTSVSWTNSSGGAGTATGTTSWTATGIALQPGSNVLTVTAFDTAGNTGAVTLTVTFDNQNGAPSTPTPAGLVAAYSFSEGSGTSVTDSSGNNHTGTISGASWTSSGRFGSALDFDGSQAVVTIPSSASLQLTTGMTLEAWVNPSVTMHGWRSVIDKNTDRYYLMASSDRDQPAVGGTWAAGNRNLYGQTAIPPNTWAHLAATFDGTMVRLYVNGVQVASEQQTTPLTTSNGTLQIGGNAYPGENFAGRIDEVRVYNRALSVTEIQADMSTTLAATPVPTAPPSSPPPSSPPPSPAPPNAGPVVLTVSPTSVAPGGSVTAVWSGIAAPTSTDWIGLYLAGTVNTADWLDFVYVSCSPTPGAPSASGSCSFPNAHYAAPGTYQLRLFAADKRDLLATSGTFTVSGTSTVPPTAPLPPATAPVSFSDVFARADNSDLGPNYDPQASNPLRIVGQRVRATSIASGEEESVNAITPANDQCARITLGTFTGAGYGDAGPIITAAPPGTRTFYGALAFKNDPDNTSVIYLRINGAVVFIATERGTTWAWGKVVGIAEVGPNLTLKRDGVTVLTANDSSLSGGRIGLRIREDGNLQNLDISAFSGGDAIP